MTHRKAMRETFARAFNVNARAIDRCQRHVGVGIRVFSPSQTRDIWHSCFISHSRYSTRLFLFFFFILI